MKNNKKGAIVIEGHVQGLSNVRSLGEIGIPVFVIDKDDCIARYSKHCKKFFKCPDFNSPLFIDFLLDLSSKESIKDWLLLPSNDHAVYNIAKNKKILQEHYKIITPDINIVENIYDKKKLLGAGINCGIPIPKTQYFSNIEESISSDIKFPVLTKGRNGLSFYKAIGRKALLAKNKSELKNQLSLISEKFDINNSFTQELIPFDGTNKTISFCAFCVEGEIKTYWMGKKMREHPLKFGTATFTESVFEQECLNNSIKLLKHLNYSGVCEVEYLYDPRVKEYKLIEINARTWLWVGHARACGVDFAKIAYNYVNGIKNDYPTQYKIGVTWYNPYSDTIYTIIAILSGKISINDYLKSMKKKRINALFYKRDNLPAFVYFLKIFRFLKTR